MGKSELDILFKNGFDVNEWTKVLSQVFKANELRSKPEYVDELSQSTGANVWYLGEKTSETDYTVGYFVFEITSGTVVHKRVGLRNLTKSIVNSQYGVYDSVVAVFYDKEHWRCSFISDIRGDKTAPKRFTFVFGDKAQGYNTAVNRFFALQTTEAKYEDIKTAFSVETLSDEFFDKYRALYANFVQYITGNRVVKIGSKWEEKKQHDPDPTLYAAFGNDDKRIRDYVKKLMGRITFLYFVQKKGWFNNDQNYLQHLFENCKYQDDFLDRVLEPFFYTVLNTEEPNRVKAFKDHNNNLRPSEVEWDTDLLKDWNDFPFLNGGLFERDENDIVRSQFPPQFFENINGYDENFVGKIPQKDAGYTWKRIPGIFDLFSQYNFTIDENDPEDAEVGIDPEMLGKIFENLLEDNKDKGAFYTPKEIVQYMCRESLIAYLQTDAKDDAHKERLRKFVTTHDASVLENPEYVRRKIKDIKVCDPAIGSGAFPMGMLNELVSCSEALDMHIDKNSNRAEIKKHIIQNSIYGVDIERGAVDIARLRFWLSLVIDEENAVPLPNLDYKIMQGNSLLEQYEGIDLSKLQINVNRTTVYEPQKDLFGRITDGQLKMTFTQETTVNNLQQLLKDYFYETKHSEKTKLKKKITKIVNDHILYNIELRKTQVNRLIGEDEVFIRAQENKIADLQTQFPNQKLSPTLTAKFDAEIQKARRRIADNEAQLQKYDNALAEMLKEDFLSSNQQFFLWHTWFADVFNRSSNQGFDVVIGNPPYVFARSSAEKGMTKEIKKIYYNNYDLAKYQVNLYHLFIEQGTNLLVNKGVFAYIVPNNWMTINTNKELRKYILEKSDIKIINFYKRVFEHADVDSSIIIFNNQQTTDTIIHLFEAVNQTDIKLIKETHCSFFFDQKDYVINIELFKNGSFAGILNKIENASKELKEIADVKCGLGAYGKDKGNPPQTKEMIQNRVYHSKRKEGEEWFKYIEGEDVKRYSLTWMNEEYLKWGKHLREPRNNWDLFSTPRILVRQIPSKLPYCINACYTEDTILNDRNSMNIIYIKENPKYVLGVLNSKALSFWFAHKFGKLQRGLFPQFKINELATFPIPQASAAQQSQIITWIDEILAIKNNNPQANTCTLETKIDKLVYQLYGLTDSEIQVIEDSKN